MKPLSLQFKETPKGKNLDYSLIEYDNILNLSVDRRTRQPAIDTLELDTETVTKADGEHSADTDVDTISMLATETNTYTDVEESDSDSDRKNIQSLLDTTTITESREELDQDI